jgi:hypothetical protein
MLGGASDAERLTEDANSRVRYLVHFDDGGSGMRLPRTAQRLAPS